MDKIEVKQSKTTISKTIEEILSTFANLTEYCTLATMNQPPLLKSYCKSVLQVELPVTVTLASKRMKVDQLLKLVPGMMIQFNKPFDAPMTVEVGGQPIAEGDVVKAGDKFGIRISNINSPAERFVTLTQSES